MKPGGVTLQSAHVSHIVNLKFSGMLIYTNNPVTCGVFKLQALEKLKEKEIVLQKKISIEVERAKEFTKAKNKQGLHQL